MGGSKFRLGRVRKYTDQQKRKPVTLIVSIPRSLVTVQTSTGLYMSPCVGPLSLCSEEQPAGYIPRALIKKIKKSPLSNKTDLLLSLHELIETMEKILLQLQSS